MSPATRKNGPNAISDLLADSSNSFGKLLRHADAINRLADRLSKLLGPELADHCKLANARDGKLVFVCTSAAWSSRLLMHSPMILEKLESAGVTGYQKIEARTRPQRQD
jgi:hypothetical protein